MVDGISNDRIKEELQVDSNLLSDVLVSSIKTENVVEDLQDFDGSSTSLFDENENMDMYNEREDKKLLVQSGEKKL